MKKSFKIILSLIILSQFIFIQKVSADTFKADQFTAQLYDNISGTLYSKDSSYSSDGYWTGKVGLTAYSSGAAWGFNSPLAIVEGHTYSLTVHYSTQAQSVGTMIFSSINRIGLGTSLSNAVSSYQSATNTELIYTNNNNDILQFVFKAKTSGSYLVVPFATTYSISTETVYFNNFVINDLGSSTDISQDDINNSLSSQTNELNNSISNSTNTITGAIGDTENNINSNIDDMEQNIIDSNKETQEVIKDQFNTCRDSKNLYNYKDWNLNYNHTYNDDEGYLIFTYNNSSGTKPIYQNYYTHDLDILPNKSYTIVVEVKSVSGTGRIAFNSTDSTGLGQFPVLHEVLFSELENNSIYIYNVTSNSSFIGDVGLRTYATFKAGESGSITIRLSVLEDSVNSSTFTYEPYGEQICTNKMDETNDKLSGIEDALTDSSSPDLGGLSNTAGWLPAGPVDSILNLPLNMLQALNTALSDSCTPLNLTIPFVNVPFQIPCISTLYEQISGFSTLWTWIGSIVSVLMLYTYLLKLYKWVDDTLTFRENNHIDNWGGL